MKSKLLSTLALVFAGVASMPAAQAANILNGIQINGIQINGLQLNGFVVNGLYTNGLYTNGLVLNGTQSSGATAVSDSFTTVQLPNGQSVVLK